MSKPRSETSRYEPTSHPSIERDKNSAIYYFRGTVEGQLIDKSLRTKNFNEAKAEANKFIAKVIAGEKQEVKPSRQTFEDAFDLLIKIQTPKSKKTLTMARSQIKHLLPWFKEKRVTLHAFESSYEEIWAEYRVAQSKLTPGRKLEHDRRHLVMALKRAQKKGWIKKVFTKKDFDLFEAKVEIGEYIEDDDVRVILRALKPYPKSHLQVMLAVYMGLRKSEILELQVEEIDLERREINLDPNRLKIRRPRKVPIPIADDVWPKLQAFVKAAQGPFIFPKVHTNMEGQPVDWNEPQSDNRHDWDWVRTLMQLDVRFHDLRHTAITNALDAGLPSLMAEKIFGATAETINRIYDHLRSKRKEQFRTMFCGRFVE